MLLYNIHQHKERDNKTTFLYLHTPTNQNHPIPTLLDQIMMLEWCRPHISKVFIQNSPWRFWRSYSLWRFWSKTNIKTVRIIELFRRNLQWKFPCFHVFLTFFTLFWPRRCFVFGFSRFNIVFTLLMFVIKQIKSISIFAIKIAKDTSQNWVFCTITG